MVKEKKKKNNYKIIIISFLLALPFWWGINILHETLEELFYLKAITSPEMQTASIVFTHDPMRDSSGRIRDDSQVRSFRLCPFQREESGAL
jgi:hypothetical protein